MTATSDISYVQRLPRQYPPPIIDDIGVRHFNNDTGDYWGSNTPTCTAYPTSHYSYSPPPFSPISSGSYFAGSSSVSGVPSPVSPIDSLLPGSSTSASATRTFATLQAPYSFDPYYSDVASRSDEQPSTPYRSGTLSGGEQTPRQGRYKPTTNPSYSIGSFTYFPDTDVGPPNLTCSKSQEYTPPKATRDRHPT